MLTESRSEKLPLEDDLDFEDDEAYLWYTIKSNQVQMIQDRGIPIPEEERVLPDLSVEEFTDYYQRKALEMGIEMDKDTNFHAALSQTYDDEGVPLHVIYLEQHNETKNIRKEEVTKKFKEKYEVNVPMKFIFISELPITTQVLREIQNLNTIPIQVFLTSEFLQNPLHHILQQSYRLLEGEERLTFLTQLEPEERARQTERGLPIKNVIQPAMLPKIRKTIEPVDPVVKWYDWPKGGIVRIERTEIFLAQPVDEYVYYRTIV
jgi:DNA-directed RNA polymerase subunit H (RpoH/RPB5)